jgi:hypothetical protein
MQVDTDHNSSSQARKTSTTSSSPGRVSSKPVTVEDSLDVISELISEIQAMDILDDDLPMDSCSLNPKSNASGASAGFLPTIKKIFHCLLSTTTVQFLPIQNDNPMLPIKTTPQVNELTAVRVKIFFKASKFNSNNITGDFHVSSSLLFQDLCSHIKVTNWLTLHGYYMVLRD